MSAPNIAFGLVPASEIIALLPRTLMWVTEGREFEAVQLRYAQKISEALSTLLARLRSESPELADSITTRLSQASEDAIGRVLLSPSVSQRLLWRAGSAAEFARFLEGCLRMEATARERDTHDILPIWGALGDCVLRDTGELVRWDPIDGRLPLISKVLMSSHLGQPIRRRRWAGNH